MGATTGRTRQRMKSLSYTLLVLRGSAADLSLGRSLSGHLKVTHACSEAPGLSLGTPTSARKMTLVAAWDVWDWYPLGQSAWAAETKYQEVGGVKDIYFLMVLEASSPRSRCPEVWIYGQQTAASSPCLSRAQPLCAGPPAFSSSAYTDLSPIRSGPHPHDLM